jgi:hypothetical protein
VGDSTVQERRAKDRAFLADEPIRNTTWNGVSGFAFRVRLPSYRALPLSCIERIDLVVDGRPVDPARMTFILAGASWPVGALGALSNIWWWILDYADLFVAADERLPAGPHEVEATIVTVEPYITAGRFSFFNGCAKRLACA